MPQNNFPEAEYSLLVERFHRPFFFEKLACDHGIVPANETEAQQLLELASTIRMNKQAVAAQGGGNSFLSEALDGLKTASANLGLGRFPSSLDRQIQQTAAALLADKDSQAAIEKYAGWIQQTQQAA